MNLYQLNRDCEYKGIMYKVVSVLSNDLLLAVKMEDYQNSIFPLQTYIIPGEYFVL